MQPLTIADVDLDLAREPLISPFGFKGHAFREKWVCRVSLRGASGAEAQGVGGLAVLWSDADVFTAHTETGGNLLMASLLEAGLQAVRGQTFPDPPSLLDRVIEPVFAYGRTITGRPGLRRTFALNALVALDHAAWVLYAKENGIRSFDAMIPEPLRAALPARHASIVTVATLSYTTPAERVRGLVREGYRVLKIKIGAPGEVEEMLRKDADRMAEVHAAVCAAESAGEAGGETVRYYLDANGRYPDRRSVETLLAEADRIGALPRILVFEEPFPETSGENLAGLPVLFAADESLHDVADVERRRAQGFGALALKPAGKTLSLTLRMAAEARRLGLPCFVADSCCLPRALDWNRNVAARLDPLPGLSEGLAESNGPESYARWDAWLAAHPCRPAGWLDGRGGRFRLDASFYASAGGIFEPLGKEAR